MLAFANIVAALAHMSARVVPDASRFADSVTMSLSSSSPRVPTRRGRSAAAVEPTDPKNTPDWRSALANYPALGKIPLECRLDAQKGWAVFATESVKKGTFLLEYAGVLMTERNALIQNDMYAHNRPDAGSYMFYFTSHGATYCIDATGEDPVPSGSHEPPHDASMEIGLVNPSPPLSPPIMAYGIGRYLNHSRHDPNLYVTLKYAVDTAGHAPRTLDGACPRLCFFANRTIAAGEELTFHYGDRSRQSRADFDWL